MGENVHHKSGKALWRDMHAGAEFAVEAELGANVHDLTPLMGKVGPH
jgi:hypothetical protein